MRRFASTLLALVLALSLAIPALAAEPRAGDTFIRVLGSNGTVTAGLRTTYGELKRANGAVYRDDRYDFVYTLDGANWQSAGPADHALWYGCYDGTQFLAWGAYDTRAVFRSADGRSWEEISADQQVSYPASPTEQVQLGDYRFQLDGESRVWVYDATGRSAELTAFDAFRAKGYLPAYLQAYPVSGGIRVVAYSRYGYSTCYEYTYTAQALNNLLGASAALPGGQITVTLNGAPLSFALPPYQVRGCTMAPLRGMAEAMGYTFSYDAASGAALCAKEGSTILVRLGSTWATVNGQATDWLAVPAQLQSGIFCVPVRFFAEAAGAEVTWDSAGQVFHLTLS